MSLGPADSVRVPYEATDFPMMAGLNGKNVLTVNWNEILWAAITVGKARRDLLRFGNYSIAEAVHRVACLDAYFLVEDGQLTLSPAFKDLDPTEKGIVSYYSGMTMAKLFAERSWAFPG